MCLQLSFGSTHFVLRREVFVLVLKSFSEKFLYEVKSCLFWLYFFFSNKSNVNAILMTELTKKGKSYMRVFLRLLWCII